MVKRRKKEKYDSMRVTAKNRIDAEKQARNLRHAIYNNKYSISDIIYVKGSKKVNYQGKKVYGIVFRKKKRYLK